ncbi:predicted transcriptional regulator [Sanguibacter keddieii DSM 10542]|uniref:Predicted transcriptional regulator n=1 Tax=Sanguibacter keddieii (strain ATCC 51767 / DSM 10542 / NCFB 3025 / ST-74) TaxID=446469 RepID=D1BEM1_SANKS|nr:MerR family transcriptional regulator [Sanguibacter keddieii]ACZ23307.1 predicted transcriptional regulator [Sanguibacter keddieii DSM 10542]
MTEHPGTRPSAGSATDHVTDRTVGDVARLAGVTVRTLHHWDTIGLVAPSGRSSGGYRLYRAADVARVHRVLLYRELGLPLERISELLDAPGATSAATLREQRAELAAHISRLQSMVVAVDRLVEAADRGILLSDEEQVAIFGDGWQPSWVAEAHDRWGDSTQWAEYAERSASMDADDWQQVADRAAALSQRLVDAMAAGVQPGSPEADAVAELHRASIDEHFTCSRSMQVCLARTYTDDPRFRAHYEGLSPGLAAWLRAVIEESARAHDVDPETATWE